MMIFVFFISDIGRKPKRCKKYTPLELKCAIESIINSTMSIRQAAKAFNIPRTTLRRMRDSNMLARNKPGNF